MIFDRFREIFKKFFFLYFIIVFIFWGCSNSGPSGVLSSSGPSDEVDSIYKISFDFTETKILSSLNPITVQLESDLFNQFKFKVIEANTLCIAQNPSSFTELTQNAKELTWTPSSEGRFVICVLGKYIETGLYQTISEVAVSPQILVDLTPPTLTTFYFNSGTTSYTTTTQALVSLASSDAVQMALSFVSCMSANSWENFVTKKSLTLPQTESLQTLYVKLKDRAENESDCSSLSLIHDSLAPSAPTLTSPADNTEYTPLGPSSVSVVLGCETSATVYMSGPVSSTQICQAGVASATLTFNEMSEGDNYFTFSQRDLAGNLSSSSYATLIKNSQIPKLKITQSDRILNSGSGAQFFTFSLGVASNTNVNVRYVLTSDAVNPTDHNLASSGTVVIPAGQTSADLNFNINTSTPTKAYSLLRITLAGTYQTRDLEYVSDVFLKRATETNIVQDLDAGQNHTCVLITSGTVRCFGQNTYKQVNNTTTDPITTTLSDSTSLTRVVAGERITCGTTALNALRCWGTFSGTAYAATTMSVPAGRSTIDFSVGGTHVCAVLDDYSLRCWGVNDRGQTGFTTATIPGTTPAAINLGAGRTARKVATGDYHTCALLDDGNVKCFGANTFGQLGIGTTGDQGTTSLQMTNLPNVLLGSGVTAKNVFAGGSHSCALLQDDSVKCWGSNQQGQLGYNDKMDRGLSSASMNLATPIFVGTNRTVKHLSLGGYHTCALLDNNKVKCWGGNSFAQLGYGDLQERGGTQNSSSSMQYLSYVNLGDGRTAKKVSAGQYHTCALLDNDQVVCWGRNQHGQRGPRFRTLVGTPVKSFGESYYLNLSAGTNHTCGITYNGQVECWGENIEGRLGDGTTTNQFFPKGTDLQNTFEQIKAGNNHTCGLRNQKLYCWGENQYGQLGDGTTTNRITPVAVSTTVSVKSFSINGGHNCLIDTSDKLFCWGRNSSGQVGVGSTANVLKPQAVDASNNYKYVGLGQFHTCGIISTDKLRCWGLNTTNQIVSGATSQYTSPINVDASYNYKRIAGGGGHTCGIRSDDRAYCWGRNNNTQVGQGDGTNTVTAPFAVPSGYSYDEISLGSTHSCAIQKTTKNIYCWGDHSSGNLGTTGATEGYSATPVLVMATGVQFNSISTAGRHTCALSSTNVAYCWGYNMMGQVGEDFVARYQMSIQNIMKYIISP